MSASKAMQIIALWAAALSCAASAQQRPIDASASVMTVRVSRTGVLSPLGHDHEIAAPITRGSIDPAARKVTLHVNADALRVRDPHASDKDRATIQETMLGAEVLDAEHYPGIVFQSTAAEPGSDGSWIVHGNLTLHGQTHPLIIQVREANGHYTGTARLRQSDFGIKPVTVAGGTIRVKDEVRIEFDIQLTQK